MSTPPSISDRRSLPVFDGRSARLSMRPDQARADDDGDDNNNGMPESSNNDRRTSRSHRPVDTPFRQQRLPKWRPLMSPRFVIPCYFVVGIAFIVVGVLLTLLVDTTSQVSIRYGEKHPCSWEQHLVAYNYACQPYRRPVQLKKKLKAPIYMYYQLSGFNQNNHEFLISKSENQLGDNNPFYDLKNCGPLAHPEVSNQSQVGETYYTKGGPPLYFPEAYYVPCGIIPWSMFNDSVIVYNASSWEAARIAANNLDYRSNITLICDSGAWDPVGYANDPTELQYCHKDGVTWSTDVGTRYKVPPLSDRLISAVGWPGACDPNTADSSAYNRFLCSGWYMQEEGHKIPYTIDEDLMVWLRASPRNDFRKLLRVIDVDLEPGPYLFEIYQRYDVSAFGGVKSIVFMSDAVISKNYVLSSSYLGIGTLCLVFGIAFAIMQRVSR